MSEKFNMKRFANYVLLHYRYNRMIYLSIILITIILIFLYGNDGAIFTSTRIKSSSNLLLNLNRIESKLTGIFIIVGSLFSFAFLKLSTRGSNGKPLSMMDLLIPISNVERYVFVVVNSTIVPFVLFVMIFSCVSSIVETQYLFNEGQYICKALFVTPQFRYDRLSNFRYLVFWKDG
ncbi:MAG: hypothetical protein SNH57_04900 [Rikenellaceae bacterium]